MSEKDFKSVVFLNFFFSKCSSGEVECSFVISDEIVLGFFWKKGEFSEKNPILEKSFKVAILL